MNKKSLAVVLILGIGLAILVGPKMARSNGGRDGVGNCYADAEATATPTICE
jgi:hypothetical protein